MWPKNRNTSVEQWLKKIESQGFRFFCVSCKRERRQTPPAKVGSAQFFLHILITTAFFTLLGWPWMGLKGVLAFVIPVGLVFETVYRLKMRSALVCPDCDFDPILYLVDREKAVKQVEEAWRKKFTEKGIPFPVKTSSFAHRKIRTRRSLDLRAGTSVSQRHVN